MPGDKNISGNEFADPTNEQVQILSARPLTTWDLDEVLPEAFAYLAAEDSLVLSGLFKASRTVTVSGRILDAFSRKIVPFQQQITVTASNAFQQFQIQTQEGFLLGATVTYSPPSNAANQSFIALGIMRGAVGFTSIQTTLCAGYMNQLGLISWPQSGIVNPREGNGTPLTFSLGNPAAGADFTFTVANAERNQIMSVHAVLTTAVAAANRQVQFIVDDGATTLYATTPGPVQAASLAWDYTGAGFGYAPTQALTSVSVHVDPNLVLQQGWRIRSATTAIQAADQWSAIRVTVRQWIDQG